MEFNFSSTVDPSTVSQVFKSDFFFQCTTPIVFRMRRCEKNTLKHGIDSFRLLALKYYLYHVTQKHLNCFDVDIKDK